MRGAELKTDAVVGDRYRLRRRLGEGGMGWIWEASHVFTHARFALKFLKSSKEEDRRRFHREVRAASAVRHPNVIGVHDFVELSDGTLVIVMDLLQGETLGAVLKRDAKVALPALAAILLPVVSALEAAHASGIVHRDLKPDNIFLSETEGNDIEVKVLDFGVAKLTALEGLAARTQALTDTGSMLGTPYYMSPEQIVAEKDLDARADIWSLGVVMYECLAGVRPTEGGNTGRVLKRILLAEFDPITDHCKDLAEDVSSLVMNMLVGDRDKRTKELEEVRTVLARHAASRVPESTRVGGRETRGATSMDPPQSSRSRRRTIFGLAAAGLALSTIASVAFFARTTPGPIASASQPPASAPVLAEPSPAMPFASAPAALPSASALASPPVGPPASSARRPPAPPRTCVTGQVLTNGHCCPRGFMWRGGRCEQDIAVTPPF